MDYIVKREVTPLQWWIIIRVLCWRHCLIDWRALDGAPVYSVSGSYVRDYWSHRQDLLGHRCFHGFSSLLIIKWCSYISTVEDFVFRMWNIGNIKIIRIVSFCFFIKNISIFFYLLGSAAKLVMLWMLQKGLPKPFRCSVVCLISPSGFKNVT